MIGSLMCSWGWHDRFPHRTLALHLRLARIFPLTLFSLPLPLPISRPRATAAAGLAASRTASSSLGSFLGPRPGGGSQLLDTRSRLLDLLDSQSLLEGLVESRVLSAERLLAFFVAFHAMAARVAGTWPLTFDLARSQSGLRIATTAAPVSASDLERAFEEGATSLAPGLGVDLRTLADVTLAGGMGGSGSGSGAQALRALRASPLSRESSKGWGLVLAFVTRNMQHVRATLGMVPLGEGSTHHGTAFTAMSLRRVGSAGGSLRGGGSSAGGGSRRGGAGSVHGGSGSSAHGLGQLGASAGMLPRVGSGASLPGPGGSWHNASYSSLAAIVEVPAQRGNRLTEPLVGRDEHRDGEGENRV